MGAVTALPDPAGAEDRLVGTDRVLAVLKRLGEYPDGTSLEELARAVGSPKSTVHRALASLRRAGLAEQDVSGRYRLGPELLRIAFDYHARRPEHLAVRPVLEELVERFGETAHYGVLEGRSIVYLAKVDPELGAVRLNSIVGGRNPAHLTGIGKCLLAWVLTDPAAVDAWVGAEPLERRTDNSISTAQALWRALASTREQGYGIDDQESMDGVNCLAVPVYLGPGDRPSGAVSVSGLAYRTPIATLVDAVDEIRGIVARHGLLARS